MAAEVMMPAAAPAVLGPKLKEPMRPTNQLPDFLIEEARRVERVPFDPKKHLKIADPERIFTMQEIGLGGQGISPVAASAPFSIFTPEAVAQMRAEIFSEPVLQSCQFASDFAKNMIRGYGPRLCPFIFDAWNSPEVLNAVSKVAGVELVPAIEYEVGHINISINNVTTELSTVESSATYLDDESSAFAWHRDSYAFVCVTMLSDCTGMIGGETAMRTGNGDVMKVRGPMMGTGVVMQGRYIEHQALKAKGGRERISMVTAFRPKSPLVRDETVLTGSRPISTRSDLYYQWSHYRLDVLEERLRAGAKNLREREHAGRKFDVDAAREFLNLQKQFLEATILELE
ncbi:hypothetical protein CkaCkLH20_04315 [Colletotrichum karsti]|uniref:Fe2OG dioxygenase domain-containing protein n=1 Tax=Colletotrichum karsti TaxID=1095194 RepID=A0A9P6I7E1_9PEZI|nr:uncharacterized protein CkaCkLH20_04315 [Colletotrichum karsti]KAF9878277.1 hypothetical protein CkaCkLH20_04315 [Colletotrichum karsti]